MSDKPVMKVGHLRIADHLILGITKNKLDKGEETFEKSNLEVITRIGWNEISDDLTSGAVDVAFTLAPLAMDLFKSGVKMKLVLFAHKNGSTLITNNAAKIKNYNDFKGKYLLVPYQLSVPSMLFHKLLAKEGLTVGTSSQTDVTFQIMAPTQMGEAIQYDEEGEIGGCFAAEPIGTQAITDGFATELNLSRDVWPNHPCCVLVVRDDFLEKNEGAVYELVDSLVKSGKFAEDNPNEAAAIGADFLDQDVKVMKKILTEPKERLTTGELFPLIEDRSI